LTGPLNGTSISLSSNISVFDSLSIQRIASGNNTTIQFKNENGVNRSKIVFTGDNESLNIYPGNGSSIGMSMSFSGSTTFYNSIGVNGFGAVYSKLESMSESFGSTQSLISFGISDGTYNPRSTISYKTQTGSAYSVIFDSAYSSGWASTNWIFNSGTLAVGTQSSVGTSGEAATIAASGANVMTIRRTTSGATTSSRILFQAYDSNNSLQNIGILESGLNGSNTSPYIALFSGTNEAVRFTHLKNLTFNGTGVPSGMVQEVNGNTPLLGMDVNFRPTDLTNNTYPGAQIRIDMRSGLKPFNFFYRAAGSTVDTNLFNINTTGQVSISGSTSFISMDGNGLSGPPSGLGYGMYPHSGIGLGYHSVAVGHIWYVNASPVNRMYLTSSNLFVGGQTTTSYGERVNIAGGLRVHSGNEWDGLSITADGTRVYFDATGAEDDIQFKFFSGGSKFTLFQNGNYAFAGSNVSDYRLKNSISHINSDYINKLCQLKMATFKMNSDEDGVFKMGFIAQEVREILPEIVTGSDVLPHQYLGVDTNGLLAITIKAVQELKAENDELREILNRNNII
jgi:hypothetical protein